MDDAEREPAPLDPEAVSPGTNVLITGPAMTGKRRLMLDLLGGSRTSSMATGISGVARMNPGAGER